jgi:hypothetical protein
MTEGEKEPGLSLVAKIYGCGPAKLLDYYLRRLIKALYMDS